LATSTKTTPTPVRRRSFDTAGAPATADGDAATPPPGIERGGKRWGSGNLGGAEASPTAATPAEGPTPVRQRRASWGDAESAPAPAAAAGPSTGPTPKTTPTPARKRRASYGDAEVPSPEKVKELPTEDEIFDFVTHLYTNSDMSVQCFVVALIYIERLFKSGRVPPLISNWKRVLFTAGVVAAKVWDDTGSSNAEFASASAGMFTLKQVNSMEAKFLNVIEYNVAVTRQLYTKVYFELQQLCERQDRTLDTKPVALEEFERIEGRSAAKADQHRERAKSIMVKSRASEPSPQSPPLDDDAELSDADSF
jgi:hypothetical protein